MRQFARFRHRHWNNGQEGVCIVKLDEILWISEHPHGGSTIYVEGYAITVFETMEEVYAKLEGLDD